MLQYSWTVPATAQSGEWRLTLTCVRKGRRLGSATSLLQVQGGSADGGTPAFPRRLKPSQAGLTTRGGGRGAGSYAPFGTVLVKGADWLGGAGVDVMSNGLVGCYRRCLETTDYGIAYQCVELANHLVVSKGWSPKIWGDAHQWFDNAPDTHFDKHPNGSGYIPVPGDIIVWHVGEGHVAVVEWVADGKVGWVEQNNSPSGRSSAPLGPGGTLPNYGRLVPTGFLHAKANKPAEAQPQPIQGSSPDLQGGNAPPPQGSSPPIQGGQPGSGSGSPEPRGYTIQDDYLGGTWARSDPGNGTWYSQGNRPPNGKYWYPNGLGVGVDCARPGAQYTVTINGAKQTWSWWAHVTDNSWVPVAVFSTVWSDGNPGVANC
jgi:hypothetical protein